MPFVTPDYLMYSKTVPSSVASKPPYKVVYGASQYDEAVRTTDHDWSCTCPDWQFRRKAHGGYCKHIVETMNKTAEEGGALIWKTNSPFDLWWLPSLDAIKLLYVASHMNVAGRLWKSDVAINHAFRVFVDSVFPYAPFLSPDGELIDMIYVPPSDYVFVTPLGEYKVHMVMVPVVSEPVDAANDTNSEPVPDTATPAPIFFHEPVKPDNPIGQTLGSGSAPRRMGIPIPKKL